MRVLLFILLIACSDESLDNEADSEKKEFAYLFDISVNYGDITDERIMKGDSLEIVATIRFDDNKDQTNYKAAPHKDDGQDFLKKLRDNDADPAYRKVSLTLDSSVKGAKLSGLTSGETDSDGRISFEGLKINEAGRHKIIAKTTINGQDLSTKTHEIVINTPLEVQLSKIRGLRVGEAFDVTINREYPLFDSATISMANFDGLMMWDGGTLSGIFNWTTTTVFKELFFYKPLPDGRREMLVKVGDQPHDQMVIALPKLGEQVGNAEFGSYDGNELIVNNLRGTTACNGDCQVDAFTIGDGSAYQASAVTDTGGSATINVRCNSNRADSDHVAIGVKVTQNNKSFYFLFQEQDC